LKINYGPAGGGVRVGGVGPLPLLPPLELLELPPPTTTVVFEFLPRLPPKNPLIGRTIGDKTFCLESLLESRINNAAKQLTRIITSIKRLRSFVFIIKYNHTFIIPLLKIFKNKMKMFLNEL
jgi:hypothetical protein